MKYCCEEDMLPNVWRANTQIHLWLNSFSLGKKYSCIPDVMSRIMIVLSIITMIMAIHICACFIITQLAILIILATTAWPVATNLMSIPHSEQIIWWTVFVCFRHRCLFVSDKCKQSAGHWISKTLVTFVVVIWGDHVRLHYHKIAEWWSLWHHLDLQRAEHTGTS